MVLHEGIAFDSIFNIAFLSDEVNEYSFTGGLNHESLRFAMNCLNAYRQNYQAAQYVVILFNKKLSYRFSCKSIK